MQGGKQESGREFGIKSQRSFKLGLYLPKLLEDAYVCRRTVDLVNNMADENWVREEWRGAGAAFEAAGRASVRQSP